MDQGFTETQGDIMVSQIKPSTLWFNLLLAVSLLLALVLFYLRDDKLNYVLLIYVLFFPFSVLRHDRRITLTVNALTHSNFWAHKLGWDTLTTINYNDITTVITVRPPLSHSPLYRIKTQNGQTYVFNPSNFRNASELAAHFLHHVPKQLFGPAPPSDALVLPNIGGRPRIITYAGLVLGALAWFAAHYTLKNEHSGFVLFLPYLMVTAPLTLGLSYLWIKRDKKLHPFKAACIASILPAFASAYAALTFNQWLSEQNGATTVVEFHYADYYHNCQSFVAHNAHYIRLNTDDDGAHICSNWEGYNPNLVQGATYRIKIVRGYFNDISFPVDAFKNAELIRPAPVTHSPPAQ